MRKRYIHVLMGKQRHFSFVCVIALVFWGESSELYALEKLKVIVSSGKKVLKSRYLLAHLRIFQVDCFGDSILVFSSEKEEYRGKEFEAENITCSGKGKGKLDKIRINLCVVEFDKAPFFSVVCPSSTFKVALENEIEVFGSFIRRTEKDISSKLFTQLDGPFFSTFIFKNSVKLLGFLKVSNSFTAISIPKSKDFLLVIGISKIPSAVSELKSCTFLKPSTDTEYIPTVRKRKVYGKAGKIFWTMAFGKDVLEVEGKKSGACAKMKGGSKFTYALILSDKKIDVDLIEKF